MKKEYITETDFKELCLVNRGKVRDIYEVGDYLLIVATDRISAFDVIMQDPIPGKGKILTRMSIFWFEKTKDIIENHIISTDVDQYPGECRPYKEEIRGRSMLVKKAKPLPVECVVRGYITGAGWNEYMESQSISGIALPHGLRESARFPEPIFTPSTKAERGEHDIPITKKDMKDLIGSELTGQVIDVSMRIYKMASEIASQGGIIVADTKMEFGIVDGRLILIDELLTPDSSRFWPKDEYEEGRPQKSYDKQFLRDYLLTLDWDKTPPPPPVPDHIIEKTKARYKEALTRIVG
ncbi:MAG: phosphoribosylaminoimidazolesuccinocarboxamide synthase [Syntrophaceae bacterium]|nr:phosphoribosylaminoimidazolesuccinocarboxamide synthase [Syntrophaceae bacterium]